MRHANLRTSARRAPRHVHPNAEQDDCHGGHRARLSLQPCGQVGRFDLPLRRRCRRTPAGTSRRRATSRARPRASSSACATILAAAGSSLDQVVAVTVYLKSASDFAAMNEVYSGFWTKDPPTRTTVVADLVLPDALVEISMIAVPTGAERVVIHPAGWIKSPNPYSYAIRTGDTLFLSGLVSRNGRDNTVVAGDINAQTTAVLDNAGELLKAAGMTLDNVVSSRIYLPDGAVVPADERRLPQVLQRRRRRRARRSWPGWPGSQYAVEITLVASSSAEARHRRRPPGEPEPQRGDPGRRPRLRVRHARQHARDEGRRRRRRRARRWRASGARSTRRAARRPTSSTASST